MRRTLLVMLVAGLLASNRAHGQVWVATFNTDTGGMVDIFDNNPFKAMIGGISGGTLQITTDDVTTGTAIDKAGRPLGSTLGGGASFSGLYIFRWSSLNEQTIEAWEAVGFLGSTGMPPPTSASAQFCGAILRHSKQPSSVGNDYLVHLDLGFGSVGITAFGYVAGPLIDLGPNAPNNTYYLAICYNGFSKVLSLRLVDTAGNRLGTVTETLTTNVPGLQIGGTPSQEINALAVTHLGWSDWPGNGSDRTTVWTVTSVAYYNNATGACNALPAEPTGACCNPADATCTNTTYNVCQGGSCASGACQSGSNRFQGPGTNCGSVTCPQPPTGACCLPDGSCSPTQTQLQCTNAMGTWQGASTNCSGVSCPQPAPRGACCRLATGACDDNVTEADCTAPGTNQGVWEGVNTTCANTTCPPPATGACCALDGTCSLTTQAACPNHWDGPGTNCTSSTACRATAPVGYVWLSTFDDNTADHVAEAADCHEPLGQYTNQCYLQDCSNAACVSTKAIVGAAAAGRLLIDVQDNESPTPYAPDKAGRLIGSSPNTDALRSTDSFSALYQFSWSQLYQNNRGGPDPGAWEFPCFFGSQWGNQDGSGAQPPTQCVNPTCSGTSPGECACLPVGQSRQVLGATLIHWRDAQGNYWVDVGCNFGSAGYGNPNTAYQSQQTHSGSATNLGPYAQGKYYQLAMGWDASTGQFTIKLYDSQNNLLAENDEIPLHIYVSQGQAEVANMRLTHIGWLDYSSARPDNFDTLWQVDRLAYYNTAFGAFREPLAPGACCLSSGSCLENQTIEACAVANGTFKGPSTTCATANCPLPPCHTPFADVDGDSDVDMDDFAVFQRCYTGPSGSFDAVMCHCFDRNGDHLITETDFSKFRQCASGAKVPANPNCEN